jgi:hypothetical protein
LTDAYESLDSLRVMLQRRREELKEKIANGLEKDDDYRTQVGRCKELKDTISRISDQIKSLSGGTDDDEIKRPIKPVSYT